MSAIGGRRSYCCLREAPRVKARDISVMFFVLTNIGITNKNGDVIQYVMPKPVKITPSQLDHIANLARLNLTSQEKEQFLSQLSSVLQYIDQLNSVDVSNLPPSFQVTDLANVSRPDQILPSQSQSEALSASSNGRDGYFSVHSTIKK